MGNVPGGMGGEFNPNDPNNNDPKKDGEGEKKKKKRFEPRPAASGRNGRRRRRKGPSGLNKTPTVMPTSKCKLRLLKLDRVKDFLLMEQEFIRNHEISSLHQQQTRRNTRKWKNCEVLRWGWAIWKK